MLSDIPTLTRKQAAAYLTSLGCRITARTLEVLACNNNKGGGPAYTRIGWKMVLYSQSDLQTWARKRMVRVE